VKPDRNPRYVTLSDGTIRNAYDLKISNQTGEDRVFHISIKTEDSLRIDLEGTDELKVIVPADGRLHQRVYIFAKPEQGASKLDKSPVRFWVEDRSLEARAHVDSVFAGDAK
jgi:hypothetical protein